MCLVAKFVVGPQAELSATINSHQAKLDAMEVELQRAGRTKAEKQVQPKFYVWICKLSYAQAEIRVLNEKMRTQADA